MRRSRVTLRVTLAGLAEALAATAGDCGTPQRRHGPASSLGTAGDSVAQRRQAAPAWRWRLPLSARSIGPDRGAWVFMTKRGGRQRPIGLGSAHDVSLKDARELAERCRRAVLQGRDPRSVLAEASGELTFDTAARELIESMAPAWRNAKHRAQWWMTLLGEMPTGRGRKGKAHQARLLCGHSQQAGIQTHHRGCAARAQAAVADAARDGEPAAGPV